MRRVRELDDALNRYTAKTYGVKVIAVLCGIRDRPQLLQHQPDAIVNDLAEAVDLILQKTATEHNAVESNRTLLNLEY